MPPSTFPPSSSCFGDDGAWPACDALQLGKNFRARATKHIQPKTFAKLCKPGYCNETIRTSPTLPA
jgi:hypothetical protein